MSARKALGRGLDALIPTALGKNEGFLEVDIKSIFPNPEQPRKYFSKKHLDEMARSIKNNGILQPLVVRKLDKGYELVAGERRMRGAVLVGLKKIPVVVRNITTKDRLQKALVENIQRSDLNVMEEARAYRDLAAAMDYTQQQLADAVGKDRVTVANTLRLLRLPDAVRRMVLEGKLTRGHAMAIAGCQLPSEMNAIAAQITAKGLSVRQAEQLVRSLTAGKKTDGKRRKKKRDVNEQALENALAKKFGTRVVLKYGKKGGRITVQYDSDKVLMHILDMLDIHL